MNNSRILVKPYPPEKIVKLNDFLELHGLALRVEEGIDKKWYVALAGAKKPGYRSRCTPVPATASLGVIADSPEEAIEQACAKLTILWVLEKDDGTTIDIKNVRFEL